MSPAQTEYQIPEGYREYPQPTAPIENEAPVSGNYAAETNGSIDRESMHYAKSAEIALENIARLRQRQAIIRNGDTISKSRQEELNNQLKASKPKRSITERFFGLLVGGQPDSSMFRIKPVSPEKIEEDAFRRLYNEETRIGASFLNDPEIVNNMSPLIGRQEFFLSDIPTHSNEWFYYMESIVPNVPPRTIRYVVSEADGVFKTIDGGQYEPVVNTSAHAELDTFVNFTKRYYKNVARGLYHIVEASDYDLAA